MTSDVYNPAAVAERKMAHCTRCNAVVEKGDLRCAVCAFTIDAAIMREAAGGGEKEAMKVFRCNGCGSATSWSAEKKALACAFCGGEVKLEELEDPPEQTSQWVPFQVDEQRARAALKKWLSSRGFFRPGDLAQKSTVDNLKPMWWPAWIFDAWAHVTWTADSNAGSGKSDWAPHAGEGSLTFERILIGASRGLTDKEMTGLTTAYDIGPARPQRPGSSDHVLEETFDVQRSAARERVAESCQKIAADVVQKQNVIPGSRYRNVNVSLVLEDLHTRRVALPAWVLAYKYDGKLFRVVVHGQDEARVLGEAPLSWAKIFAVVGAVLGVIAIGLLIFALTHRHPKHTTPATPVRPAATAPARPSVQPPARPAPAPARPPTHR